MDVYWNFAEGVVGFDMPIAGKDVDIHHFTQLQQTLLHIVGYFSETRQSPVIVGKQRFNVTIAKTHYLEINAFFRVLWPKHKLNWRDAYASSAAV